MEYKIVITHRSCPDLYRTITIPDRIVKEIDEGNREKAYDLIKAILSVYERVGDKSFYRTLDGHRFFLDFGDKNKAIQEIFEDFMLHGDYEPESVKLVKEIVKSGDTAVDLGASIGFYTLLLARLVGEGGRIISVEPTSNQFPYLVKNVEVNGYKDRVELVNAAAWNKQLTPIQINAGHEGEIKYAVLDEILPEKVDFIKMDVDGSELNALKGLVKTIERNKQLKIIIEFYPKYLKKLGSGPEETLNFLQSRFSKIEKMKDYGEGYWNLYCYNA